MKRVAILMTCHNRKEKTYNCIKSLTIGSKEANIDVYLVDDGSTDGTSELIQCEFPNVNIIKGNGDLFWNKGMHLAFKTATDSNIDYDFYMWANDDVSFDLGVVDRLVSFYLKEKKIEETIIVGYTLDESRTYVTYSAFRKKRSILPLSTEEVKPSDKAEKCVTFHGNCVLIPCSVVKKIGIIDPYYSHGIGDSDYGYMASRNNCEILLTNFPVGTCEKNHIYDGLLKKEMSLRERFRFITSRKQRPVKDWWHFTVKNGGPLGVVRFLVGYAKIPIIHIQCKYLGKGI